MDFRRYGRIAQIAALVGFFLPWVTVSCAGQPVAKLSGVNLAFGAANVRDPISGIVSAHTGTPLLGISVALIIMIGGLFLGMLLARSRAAQVHVFCSTTALALIFYEVFISDHMSANRGSGMAGLLSGAMAIRIEPGLWLTCGALGFSALLEHMISRDAESIGPSSRLSRTFGIAGLLGLLAYPALHSVNGGRPPIVERNDTPQNPTGLSDISATSSPPKTPASSGPTPITIDALNDADTADIVGASCWATDDRQRKVFASDGRAVIRVNRDIVRLVESGGYIGGNALRSTSGDILVTFRKRPGKRIEFEEGEAIPMTMTVLNGGTEASIPVLRACGA